MDKKYNHSVKRVATRPRSRRLRDCMVAGGAAVAVASSISMTGLDGKLDKTTFEELFEKVNLGSETSPRWSIRAKYGVWAPFLSAKGLPLKLPNGDTLTDRLDEWVDYNADAATWVLSAKLGYELYLGQNSLLRRVTALEDNPTGIDEMALAKYLTDNRYAKLTDIPTVDLSPYIKRVDADKLYQPKGSYLTQHQDISHLLSKTDATKLYQPKGDYASAASLKSVSDRLDDFLTGSDTDNIINKWKELEVFLSGMSETDNLASLLSEKVDKRTGYGLSKNDFTDALLAKLNGIAEGANKYILPVAKAAVLGGVMIGSSLSVSATGLLDLPYLHSSPATHCKVTYDRYGRITSGAALSASDIPSLSISKITGLQAAIDKKLDKTTFDDLFEKVNIGSSASPVWAIKAKYGLFTERFLSAKGLPVGGGSGSSGGASYDRLDNWVDYTAAKSGYVLSAKLGHELYLTGNSLLQRVSALESKPDVDLSPYVTLSTPQTIGGVKTFTQPLVVATTAMPLSGGKCTGLTAATSRLYRDALVISNPATPNDLGWMRVTGTGESDTVLEIATGDDAGAGETIVFRGYNTSNAIAYSVAVPKKSGTIALTSDIPTSMSWGVITGKPTTLGGYGITDAVTLGTAQTITGAKTFTNDICFSGNAGASRKLYWKESGYGDKFGIWPLFSGTDDQNKMVIGSAVGAAGTDPEMTAKITMSLKSGDTTFAGRIIRNGGTSSQFLMADGSVRTVRTRGSAGDLSWTTQADGDGHIPTIALLAYWNGAYTGTASNLRYCYRGQFGDIVTHSASEFLTSHQALDHINNLGNLTAVSGTTTAPSGLRLYSVYNNGYPCGYGNLLRVAGASNGAGELLLQWTTDTSLGRIYYRSKRDVTSTAWSAWGTVAYLSDVYTRADADARYYTKTQADGRFVVRQQLANGADIAALMGNGMYWSPSDGDSTSMPNRPFDSTFVILTHTNYNSGNDIRRSRIAWNGYGEMKVFDDRSIGGVGGTWYEVLTKKNYTFLDSRYYTESEADARYVNVSGDTMTGALHAPSYHITSAGSGAWISSNDAKNLFVVVSGEYMTVWDKNDNTVRPGSGQGGKYSLGRSTERWANLYANTINVSSSALVSNLNADMVDGYHEYNFVRALHGSSVLNGANMNEMLNYRTFIGSVNPTSNAPNGNGWYNVIQLAHRNGDGDGSSYVGQIALGMTVNHEQMYFRTHRTRAWQHVLTESNYASILDGRYINASGDTMTGALNFANCTANTVGDDAFFGDFNGAGQIGIQGRNGNTGLAFLKKGDAWGSSATRWAMTYDGANMTASSTALFKNLNADLLDGVQAADFFQRARSGMTTAYVDLTSYSPNATGYTNYNPGTYSIGRTSHSELVVHFAANTGSTSALQLRTSYGDADSLMYRKTIDSNRVSGPWRKIVTELNIGSYNAGSATKLATSRAIWGHGFDGTGDISGDLSGVGSIRASGSSFGNYTIHRGLATGEAMRIDVHDASGKWLFNSITIGTNNNVVIGGTGTATYKLDVKGSIIADSWLRTRGATGWYNETYGGGWYMNDTTWVRTHGNKSVYSGSGQIRSDYAFNRDGVSGTYWNKGQGAYNVAIANNASQTPLLLAYRQGSAINVEGANRLFAMEFLNSGTNLRFCFGGTHKVEFLSSGDIHAVGNIYSDKAVSAKGLPTSSDERLKAEIRDVILPMDVLLKAPSKTFTWRDDVAGERRGGTIAQYWERHFKEVVYTRPDGYLAVDYGVLAHVECISLAHHVDDELTRLKRRVDALERENKELRQLLRA